MAEPRRRLRARLLAAPWAFAAAALSVPAAALAQSPAAWPVRPVSLVVPFAPGGTTDVLARALAEPLGQALGQPVIVENRPGAGATLGAGQVAKARPDGHTLLMGAVHHTIASSVYRSLPYDFQRDLAPITVVATVPNVLVVSSTFPARSVAELVALARTSKPGLSYGSNGNGTAQHLIGSQFEAMTGTDLLHVPYKGSGPLTIDLLAGQVNLSFDTVTPVLPHLKAGKLRALAVTTARRSSALPDVPTLAESGLKGFDIGTWFGLLAPAATPREIILRLSVETLRILQSPAFRQRLDEIGAEAVGNTPEQMAAQIREETAKFAALVRQARVTID